MRSKSKARHQISPSSSETERQRERQRERERESEREREREGGVLYQTSCRNPQTGIFIHMHVMQMVLHTHTEKDR